MTIKAVFFDMGGTIERFWHSPEFRLQATPALQQKLQEAGIFLGLEDVQLYETVAAGWQKYHRWSVQTQEELPAARVWTEFIFADYPWEGGRIIAAAEDLMVFFEMRYYQREMRPEVPQVLEFIRHAGLKLGIISNVGSQGQVPLSLKNYGIFHYFDPIILSSVYGRRKPDPAIFHHAARLAQVPTSACLYVGDRIARDVLGSQKAGFRLSIQIINPFDSGEPDTGAQPDAVITEMTQLLDLLQAEMAPPTPHPTKQAPAPVCAPVRAILFDASDVLYFRPDRRRNFRTFLNALNLSESQLPEAEKTSLKQQAHRGEITREHLRQSLLHLYGITDPALIQRGLQAMDADDHNIQFFEGVPETLKRLKQSGYLLGVITNTVIPLHLKLKWFEQGGFGDVWDAVISSQDVGVQKPSPEIYHAALQQLGLPACEAVFVGHEVSELAGAHAVGLKTIAFNADEGARADFYIAQFSELLTVPLFGADEISSRDDKHD